MFNMMISPASWDPISARSHGPWSACIRTATLLGQLYPRIDYYPDAQQTMTIPGQRSTLRE